MLKGGPVRTLFNERVTLEEGGKIAISLPNKGNMLFDRDAYIGDLILENLKTDPQGRDTLRDRNYVASIFYLAPTLESDIIELLSKDNGELRKEIINTRSHLISPRGDKMIIMDPGLQHSGFKSITFELGEPKTRINVAVRVDNVC